jgi:hypothetical protein
VANFRVISPYFFEHEDVKKCILLKIVKFLYCSLYYLTYEFICIFSGVHQASYPNSLEGSSADFKQAEHESDYPPPASTEVQLYLHTPHTL